MGLFGNIFKSDKLKEPVNLALIKADMHSHLIPGIDDGSKSIEYSVELVKSLYNLGYTKLVTTPHIITDYFKNTPVTISKGLDELRAALAQENIPVQVEAAAEYMFDEGFKNNYKKIELLTFGNKYILIELSAFIAPDRLFDILFDLRIGGFTPILAHPERYTYWHYNLEHYVTLKDREILFQINLPSLAGFYGPEVRRIAEQLIEKNMVEFAGTDMHDKLYLEQVEKSRYSKHLEMLVNSGKLLNSTL